MLCLLVFGLVRGDAFCCASLCWVLICSMCGLFDLIDFVLCCLYCVLLLLCVCLFRRLCAVCV